MKLAGFGLLVLLMGHVQAHEVHHEIRSEAALVVQLSYADGSPFAYEKYELYPAGQELPAQVGNADAQGRVVFLPGTATAWRLKAYSADGHGVDMRFDTPGLPTVNSTTSDLNPGNRPNDSAPPSRLTQFLIGISVVFGVFGLWQLFLRRRHS